MTRTALQIAQDVAVKVGIDQPATLFATSDRTEVELRRAMAEALDKIVEAHDWRRLHAIATHTGDGTTTEFDLPDDYLRMPRDAKLRSTRWTAPICAISPETWLAREVDGTVTAVTEWTLYGGKIVYRPAPVTGETIKFWYVSRNAVSGDQDAFTADTDTFLLGDRILELATVAVWRAQKGLDYQEDAAAAQDALSRAIARDGGAGLLMQASGSGIDAATAYPLSVPV